MSSYHRSLLLDSSRSTSPATLRTPSTSVTSSRYRSLSGVGTSVARLNLNQPAASPISYLSENAYGRIGSSSEHHGIGGRSSYGSGSRSSSNSSDRFGSDLRRGELCSLPPDTSRNSMSNGYSVGFPSSSRNPSSIGSAIGSGSSNSSSRLLSSSSTSRLSSGSSSLLLGRPHCEAAGATATGSTTATGGGIGAGAPAAAIAAATRPASSSSYSLLPRSLRHLEPGSSVNSGYGSNYGSSYSSGYGYGSGYGGSYGSDRLQSQLSRRYDCESPVLSKYSEASSTGQRSSNRIACDDVGVGALTCGAGVMPPTVDVAVECHPVGEVRSPKCDTVVGSVGSGSSCSAAATAKGDSLGSSSLTLLNTDACSAIGKQQQDDVSRSDSLPIDSLHLRLPLLDADKSGVGSSSSRSSVSCIGGSSSSGSRPIRLRSVGGESPLLETRPASAQVRIDPCNGDVGLRNLGNTCFMSSVIQCLSSTRPLLQYVVQKGHVGDLAKARASETSGSCAAAAASTNGTAAIKSSKSPGALTEAFANLLHSLWMECTTDAIFPDNFKAQVQIYAPQFAGYSQHDAQEFLQHLLQGLHEDMNRGRRSSQTAGKAAEVHSTSSVLGDHNAIHSAQFQVEPSTEHHKQESCWKAYISTEDSKIVDLFAGQLRSTLTCNSCGFSSTTYEPFWDLSLTIPIADYRGRKAKVNLTDCLEAFVEEEQLMGDEQPVCDGCKKRTVCTKRLGVVRLPEILVLHLKRFTGERYRTKLSLEVDFPERGLDLRVCCQDKGESSRLYDLYAVINHTGTVYSGHYTALCKHPASGAWRSFDDHRVTSTFPSRLVSPEAYVLFYEACKDVYFQSSL